MNGHGGVECYEMLDGAVWAQGRVLPRVVFGNSSTSAPLLNGGIRKDLAELLATPPSSGEFGYGSRIRKDLAES